MFKFPLTAPVIPNGGPGDYVWGIAVVLLFYLCPLALAWRMLRGLIKETLPDWLILLLCFVLSPLLLALALFILGLARLLLLPAVVAALLGFSLFYRGQYRELRGVLQAIGRSFKRRLFASAMVLGVGIALLLPSFILTLPPAAEGDCVQRRGHLYLAVTYAEQGAMPMATGNVNFGAPHLYHMLFAGCYILRAPAAPSFLAFSQMILLLIITAGFAFFWWGRRSAIVAALLLIAGETTITWAYIPRTDIPAALTGTVSLLLLVEWLQQKEKAGQIWAVSLFAGIGAAIKLSGALFIPMQALLVFCGPRRKPLRQRGKNLVIFLSLPILLVLPWLIRSQLLTGTPVYPLTWRYTGGKYWSREDDQFVRHWEHVWCLKQYPTLLVNPAGTGKQMIALLRSDPALLITVGLVLIALGFVSRRRGRILLLSAAAFSYMLVIIGLLDSDPRHYLAAIAVLSVAAGGGFSLSPSRRLMRGFCQIGFAAVILLLLFIWSQESKATIAQANYILTDTEHFIAGRYTFLTDRPYVQTEFWLNQYARRDARVLLGAPTQLFWHNAKSAKRPVVMTTAITDFYLRRPRQSLEALINQGEAPKDYASRIKSLGIDYIIVERLDNPPPNWYWEQDWRRPFLQLRPELWPYRKALAEVVGRQNQWRLVFEKNGWQVYQRIDGSSFIPPAMSAPHLTVSPRDANRLRRLSPKYSR
jgi:4-amino-4-deoxy-L-arabinose transferase-like glycosyltransferase